MLSTLAHGYAAALLAGLALVLMPCVAAVGGERIGGSRPEGPVRVEIRKERGAWRLYRGGAPYYIKGAVYWGDPRGRFPLSDLAARGGNSVRCGGKLEPILDEARRLGLTATIGLPMKMESVHKFDYGDPKAVAEQFGRVKEMVLKLKDRPAVLMWGIGNELSVGYTNLKVWDAVNDVAKMIHQVDPNHPAMTVIGDGSIRRGDIKEILRRCPDLDLLGVNFYKGVEAVPQLIRKDGWEKPYVVTEWGPSGDWQVPRTKWKASIEETSTQKAQRYVQRYRGAMLGDAERCLGSYAFIWSSRRERTHTWYGMFLESGERTGAVDAMQYLWTGKWSANRAPTVQPLLIDGQRAEDSVYLKPGTPHTATARADDPDGDKLTFRWEIVPEVARAGYAGMGEKAAKPIPGLIQPARPGEIAFTAPHAEGPYRVFVFVLDAQGNAATANIPFYVRQ